MHYSFRLSARVIFFGLCALLLLLPHNVFAYDDNATHPALTNEIVSFYNAQYPDDALTAQQREWIIEGSRLEDTWPRWINHLFDPVHHTGWTGRKAGDVPQKLLQAVSKFILAPTQPLAAVEWLNNYAAQEAYTRYGGNHTWQKGLEQMMVGDEQAAYTTLGHSLHLLEDIGVPEHARDDTHAHQVEFLTGDIGSPYELYATKWNRNTLRIPSAGLRPTSASRPESFLVALAEYSNRYFFSKDTINDPTFTEPNIVRVADGMAYGKDERGIEFPLARYVTTVGPNGVATSTPTLLDTPRDAVIYDAYFERLSKQIVVQGAGMVKLFRDQARAQRHASGVIERLAKVVPLPYVHDIISPAGEAKKIYDGVTNTFVYIKGLAVSAAHQIAAWLDTSHDTNITQIPAAEYGAVHATEGLSEVAELPATLQPTGASTKKQLASNTKKPGQSLSPTTSKIAATTSIPAVKEKPKAVPLPAPCTLPPRATPNHRVLINELAWMGTAQSASHEWIELRNPSSAPVDLHNWQVMSAGGHVHTLLAGGKTVRNTTIGARGFYMLERTSEATLPSITSDALYTGALSNGSTSGLEGLYLFDSSCALVDEVLADAGNGTSWPAGEAASRKTMERNVNNFNWHTSAVAGGTPKATNSTPVPPAQTATTTLNTTVTHTSVTSSTPTSTTSVPPASSTTPFATSTSNYLSLAASHLLVSEIQVEGVDAGDEFIELYNPDDTAVDLSGGSIQYMSGASSFSTSSVSKKNFEVGPLVPAHGFFLIARAVDMEESDGYRGSVLPDLAHRSFSLSGAATGGIVVVASGEERVVGLSDPAIVDYLPYGAPLPPASGSIERKALGGAQCVDATTGLGLLLGNGCAGHEAISFDLRAIADPQNSRSQLEPRAGDGASPPTEAIFDSVLFSTSSSNIEAYLDFSFLPERNVWTPGTSTNSWSIVVPYLNSAPASQRELTTARQFALDEPSGLRIQYRACYGGDTESSVILIPSTRSACQEAGPVSGAYMFDRLAEDGFIHVVLARTDGAPFSVTDRLQFAFYTFNGGSGGEQRFMLTAIDDTPYVLGYYASDRLPPRAPSSVELSFDELHDVVRLTWDSAQDPDSTDETLTYEVALVPGEATPVWQPTGRERTATLPVSRNIEYRVLVRAVDEQGLRSGEATLSWRSPLPAPLPSQTIHADSLGYVDASASQSFTTLAPSIVHAVALYESSEGAFCCSQSHLELRADEQGHPGTLLSTSNERGLGRNDGEREVVYTFETPVVLQRGTYWLTLVVSPNANPLRMLGSSQNVYIGGAWSIDNRWDVYFQME